MQGWGAGSEVTIKFTMYNGKGLQQPSDFSRRNPYGFEDGTLTFDLSDENQFVSATALVSLNLFMVRDLVARIYFGENGGRARHFLSLVAGRVLEDVETKVSNNGGYNLWQNSKLMSIIGIKPKDLALIKKEIGNSLKINGELISLGNFMYYHDLGPASASSPSKGMIEYVFEGYMKSTLLKLVNEHVEKPLTIQEFSISFGNFFDSIFRIIPDGGIYIDTRYKSPSLSDQYKDNDFMLDNPMALGAVPWALYSDCIYLSDGIHGPEDSLPPDKGWGLKHIYYRHVLGDGSIPTFLGIADPRKIGELLLRAMRDGVPAAGPVAGSNSKHALFVYQLNTAEQKGIYLNIIISLESHELITAYCTGVLKDDKSYVDRIISGEIS